MLKKHQGQDDRPGDQADCHGANAVGSYHIAVHRLQDEHDESVQAEGPESGGHGESAVVPNKDGSDEDGQDARCIVVQRKPVDDIVAGVVTQQDFSACKDCHPADDEGKDGGDFIEGCFHEFFSFCDISICPSHREVNDLSHKIQTTLWHGKIAASRGSMSNDGFSEKAKSILKAVSYFAELDDPALASVERAAIRRAYDPEQVILIEGEPCSGLYIVESGWLKAVKIGLEGREQVLQTLGPGDVFNAISVFTDAPNQATVAALEASVVWMVQRETLLRLLDEQPALARQVVKDFAGRVMHLVRMVEDLALRSVEARLARLLLEQANGEAVQRRRWATQAEMSSRLGTVPDVLNRALRKLVEKEMIGVERHQIQILDKEGLKTIAQTAE